MSISNCEPCIIDPTESTILLNLLMCKHLYFIFPATFQWIEYKLCKDFYWKEVSGKKIVNKKSYYSFFSDWYSKNHVLVWRKSHETVRIQFRNHTNSLHVDLIKKQLLVGKSQLIFFPLRTQCSCRHTHTWQRHIQGPFSLLSIHQREADLEAKPVITIRQQ